MNKIVNLLHKLQFKPLALLPEALSTLTHNIETLANIDFSELIEEVPTYQRTGKVGIININGALYPKANKLEKLLGLASYADIRRATKQAAADDSEVVILNVDSPGGVTSGVIETAQAIRNLKQSKHVITYSGDTMASAAYWLGSQAHEVIVSPSASVGSIGVYIAYLTYGRAMQNEGITPVIVQKGALKTLGLPAKDATAEELAYLEGEVSKSYDQFKTAVSHRNLDDSIMQGQTFDGEEAATNGLADGIEDDLDDLISFLNAA